MGSRRRVVLNIAAVILAIPLHENGGEPPVQRARSIGHAALENPRPPSPVIPDSAAGTGPPALVAQIYPTNYHAIVFGDTDHDGRREAILYVDDMFTFHYRILEEQGGNHYTDEFSGDSLIPYGVGDFDRDGRSDLVGQEGARIRVYESLNAHTYPSRFAWQSPALMNVESFIATGDTDGDGRSEFLYSYNPLQGMCRFYIFENTGNDQYAQVYTTDVRMNDNSSEKVIADFDGDGRTEIAMSGLLGYLDIYESSGDNAWSRTATISTGMTNAYGCKGGIDTNGNGKPEIFVSGIGDTDWETHVYESVGDNLFAEVGLIHENDGTLGTPYSALADLDGTPPAEFIMEAGEHFWVYRWDGATWARIAEVKDRLGGGHIGLQTADVNRNGRPELFWDAEGWLQSHDRTKVLEYDSTAGLVPVAQGPPPDRTGRLAVSPRILRMAKSREERRPRGQSSTRSASRAMRRMGS